MRAKQARQSVANHPGQLTLFALLRDAHSENPPTQALPADIRPQSRNSRGLPKPCVSGPVSGENPTTTALDGRPRARRDPEEHRSPIQEFVRHIAEWLRADPKIEIDNRRINELSRRVFGAAVGSARDAYDAAEAGMNLHIDEFEIDFGNAGAAIRTLLDLTERMP